MADKPILFSAPMVRALLAGTKTQTRRVIKPQPFIDDKGNFCVPDRKVGHWNYGQHMDGRPYVRNFAKKLRIKVGARLWVRETWTAKMVHGWTIADARSGWYQTQLVYRADGADSIDGWWPAIHMPREFSRITLTVTDVRVERLQEISEEDALAEGSTQATANAVLTADELAVYASTEILCPEARGRILYESVWNSINGSGSWEANPWVAAYTFSVQLGNIDRVRP